MNDENDLNNNTGSLSTQYIPTLIALDGDKVKERTNNNNISIISINEPDFNSIEDTINATNNVSVAGFSRGGAAAIYQSANAIANGATISSVFVIDDGTPHVGYQNYDNALQTIASSGTSIYFIGQHSDNNNSVLRADAEEYAKTAGTAIVIRNTNTSGHGSGYNQIYTRSISDNLVGFLNGSGELTNTQDYQFDVFNNTTNSWATYNYEEFIAKVNAGEIVLTDNLISQAESSIYSPISFTAEEIVETDKEEILSYMSEIRKNLKIEANVHSYGSTTAIPNSESEAVQQFFEATLMLFNAIESDTRFILSVNNSLEELDKKLKDRLGNMNNGSSLGDMISTVTSAIGGFMGLMFGNIIGSVVGSEIGKQFGNFLGDLFGLDTSSTGSTESSGGTTVSSTENRTVVVNEDAPKKDINDFNKEIDAETP